MVIQRIAEDVRYRFWLWKRARRIAKYGWQEVRLEETLDYWMAGLEALANSQAASKEEGE